MADQKRETKLWQRIKKYTKNIHFTRIESRTINGIPDVFGCHKGISFWMELKSDYVSYPKLSKWQIAWINKYIAHGGVMIICNQTLLERCLKLYRPRSSFTDPRTLVPDAVLTERELRTEISRTLINLVSRA